MIETVSRIQNINSLYSTEHQYVPKDFQNEFSAIYAEKSDSPELSLVNFIASIGGEINGVMNRARGPYADDLAALVEWQEDVGSAKLTVDYFAKTAGIISQSINKLTSMT